MLFPRRPMVMILFLAISGTFAQVDSRSPHIGYLYPAGGQQGTVVRITAGGQFLRGADKVYISGKGVRGSVLQYIRPTRNLDKEQRQELQHRMSEIRDKRMEELRGFETDSPMERPGKTGNVSEDSVRHSKDEKQPPSFPDHPLLYDLENKSLRELAHITDMLFRSRNKRQPNRQLAESVIIEIAIDKDADLGNRELRIATAAGLTNPLVFQVSNLPEISELEPNGSPRPSRLDRLLPETPLNLPVMLNGQILPGDVDFFYFYAEKGQHLVVQVHARNLMPYLADAVPGWFQASLALYDESGREVAYSDDYRFSPDSVMLYRILQAGEYKLEIRDSIYRGREDFVYRISAGSLPFITQIYPLGSSPNKEIYVSISGWNLTASVLPLNTQPGEILFRRTALLSQKTVSNEITYAVQTLSECFEKETNDTLAAAQKISLPYIINGRVDRTDDIDVFQFDGKNGDWIVAEVYARRLSSPLDSLLRLLDHTGKILQWNDDHEDKQAGLLTHHADSYLKTQLPATGTYYLQLSDAQRHGDSSYGYRLRISSPQPDFAVYATPSSLNFLPGGSVPICLHAVRKDGFEGEIQIDLKEPTTGFTFSGGWIPPHQDSLCMTLTASPYPSLQPIEIQLQATATIEGKTMNRRVIPAENMMQAFINRHLVPTQQLMAMVRKSRWRVPNLKLVEANPVRISPGDSQQVNFQATSGWLPQDLELELNNPPKGITLQKYHIDSKKIHLLLHAEEDAVPDHSANNLIVEATRKVQNNRKEGKSSAKSQSVSLGVLPAIPFEIVPK